MNQPIDRNAITRMLMRLFECWQLENVEQLNTLGLSKTHRAVLVRYRKGVMLSKNHKLIDRAGLQFGIHKDLRLLFPNDRNFVYTWVKTRNKAFENRTPIDVICEFCFAGLLMVRAYLDKALHAA